MVSYISSSINLRFLLDLSAKSSFRCRRGLRFVARAFAESDADGILIADRCAIFQVILLSFKCMLVSTNMYYVISLKVVS